MSIDAFERGEFPERSVPERVIELLGDHSDTAFTRSEIATRLDADPNTVGRALSRLKDRDLVRHRGDYWAITDDTDRVVAAFDLHGVTSQLDAEDGGIGPDAWDETAPNEPHPSETVDT